MYAFDSLRVMFDVQIEVELLPIYLTSAIE